MAATARSLDFQFQLLAAERAAERAEGRGRRAVKEASFALPPSALCPPPSSQPSSSQRDDVRRLRESLTATVGAKVMNATELIRALEKARRDEIIPTTLAPLDTLLGGGLPRGKMIEIVGRRSTGRFAIAMSALAAATSMGEAAVLVDLGDHFDPRIAEENGVDLRRLLWIRPKTLKQAVMSVEMITATGFQLVVLDVGLHPLRGRRVPDAAWVRLGRTAEAHGAALMISTPYPLTGTASEAVVIAERSRAKWLGKGKSPRVLAGTTLDLRLEKHRHMKAGTHATLTLQSAEGRGHEVRSSKFEVRKEKASDFEPRTSNLEPPSLSALSSSS